VFSRIWGQSMKATLNVYFITVAVPPGHRQVPQAVTSPFAWRKKILVLTILVYGKSSNIALDKT